MKKIVNTRLISVLVFGLTAQSVAYGESSYLFQQRLQGLKASTSSEGPVASTPEERTGHISTGQVLASDKGVSWFGEVRSADFITGVQLAQAVGLSAGNAVTPDAGWLHVEIDGKELFIAKQYMRTNVSWNHINAANAVFGSKTVEIDGATYKVRLMSCQADGVDPSHHAPGFDVAESHGSEWNRIFYRLTNESYADDRNKKTSEEPFVHLARYSETDLYLGVIDGYTRSSWCQESNLNGYYRLRHGGGGVSHYGRDLPEHAHESFGWRPVLEKV